MIGGSAWSPIGEPESVAGGRLPLLRAGHLGGLLLLSALAVFAAASGTGGADTSQAFVRNLAGYGGLALLGARFLGGGIGWVVPLSYAAVALLLDERARLAWLQRIPVDTWSITVATLLLAVGLGLVTLWGARLNLGEDT